MNLDCISSNDERQHFNPPVLMAYLLALLGGLSTLHPKHVVEFINKVIDARIAEHFTVVGQYLVPGPGANGSEEGAQ